MGHKSPQRQDEGGEFLTGSASVPPGCFTFLIFGVGAGLTAYLASLTIKSHVPWYLPAAALVITFFVTNKVSGQEAVALMTQVGGVFKRLGIGTKDDPAALEDKSGHA